MLFPHFQMASGGMQPFLLTQWEKLNKKRIRWHKRQGKTAEMIIINVNDDGIYLKWPFCVRILIK